MSDEKREWIAAEGRKNSAERAADRIARYGEPVEPPRCECCGAVLSGGTVLDSGDGDVTAVPGAVIVGQEG